MAGARDYMPDLTPPAYGPPDLASALFKMISGIPGQYQQGKANEFANRQAERTERLQQPYVDEEGKPITDFDAIQSENARRGLPPDLALAWKQKFLDHEPPTPSPWDAAGGGSTDHQTGDQLQQGAARTGGPVASDRRGPINIRQLAIDADVDPSNPDFVQHFGSGLLDRNLTPGQAKMAADEIEQFKAAGGAGPVRGGASAGGQPEATASFNDRFGSAAPPPSSPGVPAQGTAPAGPAMASPSAGAGPSGGAGAGLVPAGIDPLTYAQRMKAIADKVRTQAHREGIAGIPSKALEDRAAAYDKVADRIFDSIKETDPAKLAFDRAKGIDKLRSEEFQKNKIAIFKAGQQAEDSIPQIEFSRRVVSSPGFNSGFGHEFFDSVQSLSQQLFGGTALKNPGEIYDKFRSGEVLNQIRSLGASGIGAVRVPEMKAVDKLIADRDVQAPGIRTVTEVESRLQKRIRDIYYQAQEYLQTHRELDDGFAKQVSAWKNKPENHLFTAAELANPSLLSMPVFSSPAEMRASRMPKGTPFRNPSGEVGTIP